MEREIGKVAGFVLSMLLLVADNAIAAPQGQTTTLSTNGSTRGTAYAATNKIVTLGSRTHAAWLDSGSVTMIRTYDAATGEWGDAVEVGRGKDNHGGPALCADSKGHLHIVFGPHHGPFQYRRSVRPNDIAQWTPVEEFGDTSTYPSLVCDSRDTLHIAYRGGASPWKLMYQRRPGGGPWSDPVALVRSPVKKGYTQWGNALAIDDKDRLHLAYHFYDVELHKAGVAVGYLYSDDAGGTWRTTSGKALELPGTLETCEPILHDKSIDIRVGNVALAPDGTVFITVVHYEKGADSELWKLEDGRWTPIPLTPHTKGLYNGTAVAEAVASCSADGVLYVALTAGTRGWGAPGQEVGLLVSRDKGKTFSARRISTPDPDVPNWLANIERNTGHAPVTRPHILFTHGHPGEGCTPDIKTEIVFVTP